MIEVGYVKDLVVQVNLQFVNKFVSTRLPELYLLCKLRLHCMNSGGSFKNFKFTKNERYNILPNMEHLGWVDIKSSRVVKYRNILSKSDLDQGATFEICWAHLQSIKRFKGFILAINERYILECKKNSSYGHPLNEVKQIGTSSLHGRAFNADLSRIMGVSIPTISRWRSESLQEGFNEYDLKAVRLMVSNPSKEKLYHFDGRKERGSFFIKPGGAKFTRDLTIKSDLKLFYTTLKVRNTA